MPRILSIKNRLDELLFGKLAQVGLGLFAANIFGGLLGYAYQIVMGRMFSTADYALFAAITGLFAFLSAPLGTLTMVLVRRVSEYRAESNDDITSLLHRAATLWTLVIGSIFVVAYTSAVPWLKTYLGASDSLPVYLLGVLILVHSLLVISLSFLQGMQKFAWLSASNTASVIIKIVSCIFLVWLGLGVSGAIGGIIISSMLSWFLVEWVLRKFLQAPISQSTKPSRLSLRQVLPVLLANVAFTAMTQLDVVLVNHYFAAHDAGLYAAASVLGKAVMYLPGGIVLALLPMVAENHAKNEGSIHLFKQAFGLTFLLCGIGSVAYWILGDWIVRTLYGENYAAAGEVLRYFGFAIMPMALVMVGEYFLIAKGRVLFAYLFVVVAPLQVLAIHYFHESLFQVIAIISLSGVCLAGVGYGLLWFGGRSPSKTLGSVSVG